MARIVDVDVVVDNRTARLVGDYPYDKLIPYWSFAVPSFGHMLRMRPWYRKCKVCNQIPSKKKPHTDKHPYTPVWDGKIKMLTRNNLSAGLLRATMDDIEQHERLQFQVESHCVMPDVAPKDQWLKSEGKYDFQNECVYAMYAAARMGGGLILNATGSGKTRIAAMLASRFTASVVFVVDQVNLMEQAQKDISKHLGEEVGIVGDSKFNLKRVTVATIQTLQRHRFDKVFKLWFERVEILFIDEIHEQMNKRNFDVIDEAKPLAVYGLTATLELKKKPVRLKAWALAGPVLYTYPIQRGMSEGVLAKGIVVCVQFPNEIVSTHKTDSKRAYDELIIANKQRNKLIASIAKEAHRRGRYTILLLERLKHLHFLSKRLEDVAHAVVAGTFRGEHIESDARARARKRFESGKIRLIIASRVFKKGVDIRRVDTTIDGAAKASKNDAVQKFGRGIRTHDEKQGLLHFDISDVDSHDKGRDRKNWLARAAKRRKRAFKAAGITVKEFKCSEDGGVNVKKLFDQAEEWLQNELKKKKK